MLKKSYLALLLVFVLILSGCSLVVKDDAVDAKRVIIDVNGETVDKQTVNAAVDYQLQYTAYMYSMYGYSYDTTSEENRTKAIDTVIDGEVNQLVKKQKIKELGYDQFTDEEITELTASSKEQYTSILDSIKSMYLSSSTNEGDALTAEAEEYAKTNYGYTPESMLENAKATKSEEKLKADAVKDVTVSEDEIKADYDSKVESAKTSYASDITAYGKSVNAGSTVYYAPAGYRYVKQILVKFKDEDSTAITTAKTALTDAQTALTTAQTALTDNETKLAAEGITDDDKKTLTDAQPALKTAVDDAQAKVDAATAAVAAATETAYANIQATVDEVYQKAIAGDDFDALMETYNQDPGMQKEPGKTNGYAVCAGYTPFETAFVEAAMALEKIGDISAPVKSDSYGFYIIRYQGDIAEGAVDIATVRDGIQSALLSTKQDEAYDAAVKAWRDASSVKIYKDRLSD